jgi:hypothetical protein
MPEVRKFKFIEKSHIKNIAMEIFKKKYKSIRKDSCKINFRFITVHTISGLSSILKEFRIYSKPEEEI